MTLLERVFEGSSGAVNRSELVREIQDHIAGWEQENGPVSEFGVGNKGEPATSPEERARIVHRRLVDTGWLIERRVGFGRLVDMDPDAVDLLKTLVRIGKSSNKSYGGAVLSIFSGLEAAAKNPKEFSGNVANACEFARDFDSHMQSVSLALRKVEAGLQHQELTGDIFRYFFEDFVEQHLITDFKTLHTRYNPFRFRTSILKQARAMMANAHLIGTLADAYEREGRAGSFSDGRRIVLDELTMIVNLFESMDDHLTSLDDTVKRLERRITNVAKYMDNPQPGAVSDLTRTLKLLSSADSETVGVDTRLLSHELPIGPPHIALPNVEKRVTGPALVREHQPDPEATAVKLAKGEYLRRTKATIGQIRDYIERTLGDTNSFKGSEAEINTLDDFIAFQRLRELGYIFDGNLTRDYDIRHLDERCENEWINCQNFEISRRGSG